jgi:hypothetical protein
MKMACLGGHFLVFISEDTKKDHERYITFLWNPNGLFVQIRDKSRWDDSGWWPLGESKPDVLLEAPKEKSNRNKDGQWLFGDKLRHLLECLLSVSWSMSLKSLFEVVTS